MEISHEQYVNAFNALPKPIVSFIIDDKVQEIVADIGKKYSFHVDAVGQLAQGATYMLMGLISPAELLGELVLADIDTGVAKNVLAELNQRIFIPLREEVHQSTEEAGASESDRETAPPPVSERELSSASLAPTQPVAAQAPSSAVPAPITAAQMPHSQEPVLPVVSSNEPGSPYPFPSTATPVAPAPEVTKAMGGRTMASDMELAHGLPAGSAMPARSFQTASVPITRSTPRAAVPEPPRVEAAPAPLPPQPLPPSQSPQGSTPLNKEYGNDPYREPLV